MFYVGDILWLEEREEWVDIPNKFSYTGYVIWPEDHRTLHLEKGLIQSPQNPITQEWLPAYISEDGSRYWYDCNHLQSFQEYVAHPAGQGQWMPAIVWPDGERFWYDQGKLHSFRNPITGELMPSVIHANGLRFWDTTEENPC